MDIYDFTTRFNLVGKWVSRNATLSVNFRHKYRIVVFSVSILAIEEDPLGHGLEAAGSVVESHGNSMNHQSWQIQSTSILLRTRKFLGWIWLKCGNILNSTFWSLFKNLFHLYKSANGPTTTARSFHMARTNISTRPPIWLYDMVHIPWVD